MNEGIAEQCRGVEALFVERQFESARDASERFFESHFKRASLSPLAQRQQPQKFGTCIDLSASRVLPSLHSHCIARVAAVLLQCSHELRDPAIADYVTAVYRQTNTMFP